MIRVNCPHSDCAMKPTHWAQTSPALFHMEPKTEFIRSVETVNGEITEKITKLISYTKVIDRLAYPAKLTCKKHSPPTQTHPQTAKWRTLGKPRHTRAHSRRDEKRA